jgi:valyl-tRNA synthetase
MISEMPRHGKSNKTLIDRFGLVKETVSSIRTIRKSKNLPARDELELFIKSSPTEFDTHFLPVIVKMGNLSGVSFTESKKEGAASFQVGTMDFYIPVGTKLDVKAEIMKINEELKYHRGFLLSVMKKLDNERFVQNAPPSVIEIEKQKKADAEMKINSLEERLKEMEG